MGKKDPGGFLVSKEEPFFLLVKSTTGFESHLVEEGVLPSSPSDQPTRKLLGLAPQGESDHPRSPCGPIGGWTCERLRGLLSPLIYCLVTFDLFLVFVSYQIGFSLASCNGEDHVLDRYVLLYTNARI